MVLNLFLYLYLNKKANKIKNSSQTNYKDIYTKMKTHKEKKKKEGIYVASKIFPQTSRLGLHSQQSTVK